jgi:hypothetical protein
MASTYNKYALWCDTCGATRYTDYRNEEEGEPTVCPFNAAHTNIRDITIVDTFSTDPMSVKIEDTEDIDPAKARSKVKGVNFDAVPQAWTKHGVSFPYKTNILCGKGYGGFCEDGDKVEFSVEPQQIGAVMAPAAQGATVINAFLPPEAWAVLLRGMWLQFARNPGQNPVPDSQHPGDDEYEIGDFDEVAETITLRTGLATALAGGDAVFMVVKYGEEIELQNKELVDVGADAAGSASLPANTVFNVWYYNAGTAQKRVRFRLSFKYGPPKSP